MPKTNDHIAAVTRVAEDYCVAMVDNDADAMRRLFHPKASVIGNEGGGLSFDDIETFIGVCGDAKTGTGPFDYHVHGVSVIGDMAVVTVSNYSFGAWYSDFLSMILTDGEWKIVAKTFSAHP